jgi:hypothetical protein
MSFPAMKGQTCMPNVVVRYQTKPDRADENQQLIERVFAELNERDPGGFRYIALRLADGVSFMHIVVETGEGNASLADMKAFQEFTANIAERCDVPPAPTGVQVVGSYRIGD